MLGKILCELQPADQIEEDQQDRAYQKPQEITTCGIIHVKARRLSIRKFQGKITRRKRIKLEIPIQ